MRHTEIGDVRRGDFLIRDDDHIAVSGRYDGGKSPGNIGNTSFFAGVQADVVAEAKLLGEDEMQAGENIGQRFLQRKRDSHSADAQCGEDRSDGYSIVLQNDQDAHGINDAVDDDGQQRRFRQTFLRALNLQIDDAADGPGQNPGERQDDHGKENIGKNTNQRLDDVDGVDDPVQTGDETQRDRNAAQCVDEDGLPSRFRGRDG